MSIENPPAFPVIAENGLGHVSEGMSLRDWFAGQALVGVISGCVMACVEYSEFEAAEDAYEIAAAMLAERAKAGRP